ncbi:MAG TPA: ABC transporter permease subunit [Clostridiales bacterium]|nr:ABC transporter permease subunit [Clostridiales bacterium]
MRNTTLKNALRLTAFDLKTNRKLITGWFIAIFATMFLYMILFPSVKDMAQFKMEAMPPGVMELFGMEDLSVMSDYVGYFGMVYVLVLIAISVFAVTFSAGLLSKEEKTKTIEFLYSLTVSRSEIYLAKLLTAIIANLLIIAGVALATFGCGMINGGPTFVPGDLLQILTITSLTVFFFMSVGLMIAGVSNQWGTPATGSMVVIASYLLGYLGTLLNENAAWLQRLSPFEEFSPTNALSLTNDIRITLGVYCTLSLIFIGVGLVRYRHRDFNV